MLIFSLGCHAQTGDEKAGRMKEVIRKLSANTPVSDILTDPAYLVLHPETEFRNLVQANCDTRPIRITTPNEPGKKIKVVCTVTNAEAVPLKNVLVYLYQTDAKGWYAADALHVGGSEGDMRHARLFGYVKTDELGKFELHTIKPSGYPRSDLPAHIHVHFEREGYRDHVTEFLFDDDPRLVGSIRDQAIRSRFPIALPEKTTSPFEQQFQYTIKLIK
jgi:protocatechuate 3,4-dioxygenase beta subunit